MYFNRFASGLDAIDMAETDEFVSLLEAAKMFGTPANPPVRYLSRNIVANGLRFHLLEWGDPSFPTVLLLHGGNHTAHTWDLISLALADRYHVIAIDQRGHGDSEWPRDGDMTVTAMSGDLAPLFEILDLQRPLIMAHSRGGRAAMPFLAGKDLAEKLVLVDVAPSLGLRLRTRVQPESGIEGARASFEALRTYPSVDSYVEAVQKVAPGRSRESVLSTMRYNMHQRIDGTLVAKTAPLNAPGATDIADPLGVVTVDDVKDIRCPVLMLRGADSEMLSQEGAEEYANALPNARLVVVPNCGHNVHTQNTLGFLAEAVPFIGG